MLAYGHVVTMCLKTTYIMPISSDEMLSQFGGNVRNDLNNLLDIDEIPDPDGEIVDSQPIYPNTGTISIF